MAAGFKNRLYNRHITRASAKISRKHVADPILISIWLIGEKRVRSRDESWCTEPALKRVVLSECGLQWRQIVARQTLDGHNLLALRLNSEHKASPNGRAVYENRAGTAHAMLARKVRACLPMIVSNAIRKRGARLDLCRD